MTGQKKKKQIPIGIDDFAKLIEGNYYFADKSLLIKEILDSGAAVTLIPRPRRFGKTLNLSMLRYFFEKVEAPQFQPPAHTDSSIHFGARQNTQDKQTSDSSVRPEERETRLEACPELVEWGFTRTKNRRHLFNGLNIEQHPDCMKDQGNYPIIWMTFKDVKTTTWEPCYEKIRTIIGLEYERHLPLIKPFLTELEITRTEEIISGKASQASYENSLLDLSRYLERTYQSKVIVLIDEYDAPIHAAYLNNYYNEVVNFMRGFMGAGLKGNISLQFGILTGILRIAKESIFSGLNNLRVCTLLHDAYADKFGFLENEVETMLADFGLANKIDEIRQWYDGYQSGKYKVYNPWSIINLLDHHGKIGAYWVNTSDNALIKDLLRSSSPEMKEDLEILIDGGKIEKHIQENIVMTSINKNEEVLWNFLLFCGYLTFDNYRREESEWLADLFIPNTEVVTSYKSSFKNWFLESSSTRSYQQMLESLVNGETEQFEDFFTKLTRETLSSFDIRGDEPEQFYHALVLGMLASLSGSHQVRSNRESGYGRYDVMLIPKDKTKLGIIIEFKKVQQRHKETLEIAAQNALKQIEEKQYETELHALGIQKIFKLGIAFEGKESKILFA